MKIIVENYFLLNYFPGRLSTTTPDNKKKKLNVVKVIEVVINEFGRERKTNRSCLLIDTGFPRHLFFDMY